MDAVWEKRLLERQREEATGAMIYAQLAGIVHGPKNQEILKKISQVERSHYDFWKGITERETPASRVKVFLLAWLVKLLGLSFGIKLIERLEEANMQALLTMKGRLPGIETILQEEEEFEHDLLGLIEEDRLKYTSDIVLGLSDALIELTGVLSGLTLALGASRSISSVALITGLAASMSMAASQFLSSRDEEGKSSLKSGLLTGLAYVLAVTLLVLPFLLMKNPLLSLGVSFVLVVLIIASLTFYVSVAKDLPFKPRFFEMCTVCLGVAVLNFGVGRLVKATVGFEV
jgi:VIT1/CCC1 family predicted Fe2+/Mn2+ transporter